VKVKVWHHKGKTVNISKPRCIDGFLMVIVIDTKGFGDFLLITDKDGQQIKCEMR